MNIIDIVPGAGVCRRESKAARAARPLCQTARHVPRTLRGGREKPGIQPIPRQIQQRKLFLFACCNPECSWYLKHNTSTWLLYTIRNYCHF